MNESNGKTVQGGRKAVIQKIIKLIIEDMEEEGKGRLTSVYATGLLKEAIADIEKTALMRPVAHALYKEQKF